MTRISNHYMKLATVIAALQRSIVFTNYAITQLVTTKKFELTLTRRAKAYSSSCLQTVSLSPAISLQFILGMCAAAEDRKNQQKPLILEVQNLSKSPMLIQLKGRHWCLL